MHKLILEYDNNIYIKYISQNDIFNKHLSLQTIFINTIDKKYINNFIKNINNYYFIKDTKLIHSTTNLKNIIEKYTQIQTNRQTNTKTNSQSQLHIHNIKCYTKQKGGGDPITDAIGLLFKPIIDPIMMIGDVFMMLINFIIWLVKFVVWFVFFLIWLFTDLLNPVNFFTDFFNTIVVIVYAIFSSIFNIILGLMATSVNTVGGWMQGFWGWDQSSLTKADRESNYFSKMNRSKGKKCYLTNTNTVPFSIILGTILCPPIGVFMDMGLTGWLNIVICILLTLLFYIPGLVYALLIIYA